MDIFVFLIRFILHRLPVFPQQYVPACEDEWEPSSGQTSAPLCRLHQLSSLSWVFLTARTLGSSRIVFFLSPTYVCVCVLALHAREPCVRC